MNLYLAGMIGSGKTTIGERLASELGVAMLDLDREMDRRLGYSFHRLVAEEGWLPFRELEYAICRDFAACSGCVVCLGGGTVRYAWNRDVLRGSGRVVLLEAREEELIRRVSLADRPRVNPGTDLSEDIRRMWRTHAETYRSAADLIYRSDEKTLDQEIRDLRRLVDSEPMLGVVREAFQRGSDTGAIGATGRD